MKKHLLLLILLFNAIVTFSQGQNHNFVFTPANGWDGVQLQGFTSSSLDTNNRKLAIYYGVGQSDRIALYSDLSNYAPISGSANYIQNQISSPQTADMWITGDAAVGQLEATANSSGIIAANIANFNSGGRGALITGGNTEASNNSSLMVNAYDNLGIAAFYKDKINLYQLASLSKMYAGTGGTDSIMVHGSDGKLKVIAPNYFATISSLSGYLPLTAGSGNPLSNTLYSSVNDGSPILLANTVTTNQKSIQITNTGGNGVLSISSSGVSGLFANGLAYATILGTANNTALQFGSNLTIGATLLPSGFFGIGYTADPTSGNLFAVNGGSYLNGNLDVAGSATATSISKSGGLPTQFLMADGSTTTTSNYIQNQQASAQPANVWIDGDIYSRSISTAANGAGYTAFLQNTSSAGAGALIEGGNTKATSGGGAYALRVDDYAFNPLLKVYSDEIDLIVPTVAGILTASTLQAATNFNSPIATIYGGGTKASGQFNTRLTDSSLSNDILYAYTDQVEVDVPLTLKGYTVATLPAGTLGMEAYVTDALSPVYLGALTGGGTTKTPVFYNGTSWVAH